MIITALLFKEFFLICVALVLLAFCGGWLLYPFRSKKQYFWLAAPQTGLLALAVSLALAYNCRLLLPRAVGICIPALCLATLFLCGRRTIRFVRTQYKAIGVGLAVALVLTFLVARETGTATIHSGGSALLMMDGTDQAGYAHLADWVRTRPRTTMPQLDPNTPYSSWPVWEFAADPRFGTFYLLGAASVIRNQTGIFTYDFMCGIALASGILALAGIFCATPRSLVLTVMALSLTLWLEYSRTGYLGKILGYPSTLLVIGLCINEPIPLGRFRFPALGLLCMGAAIMHSYLSTACMIFIVGIGYPAAWALHGFHLKRESWQQFLALGFLAFFALGIGGIFGVPPRAALIYPDWDITFPKIWPRLFEIDSLDYADDTINLTLRGYFLVACILAHGIALWIAFQKKAIEAIVLLLGPVPFILGIWYLNAPALAVQVVGTPYPMYICALAVLLNYPQESGWGRTVFAGTIGIAILSLGMRLPRFKHDIDRYCRGHYTWYHEFAMSDFNKIHDMVGTEPLFIDVIDPATALVLFVDLYGRDMDVQWSPGSWNLVVGYRAWPVPVYTKPARYKIINFDAPMPGGFQQILKTSQFKFIRQS